MITGTTVPRQEDKTGGQYADIPGVIAMYAPMGASHVPLPDTASQAIEACRLLNADVVAIETDDQVTVVTVNCYDNTCAAAVCKPGVSLSVVARRLQLRLLGIPASRACQEFLPAASVRRMAAIWERKIALVFGRQYAAGLIAAIMSAKMPDSMTVADMEEMRRRLILATGDCIDLPVTC